MAPLTKLKTLWAHHSLRLHIAALFTLLIVASCGAIIWSNYIQGRLLVLAGTDRLVRELSSENATELRGFFAPVEALLFGMSGGALSGADSYSAREAVLPSLAEVLTRQRQVDALYAGYDNGEFFLLRASCICVGSSHHREARQEQLCPMETSGSTCSARCSTDRLS